MSATELFFDTIRQLDAPEGSDKLVKADIYGADIGDAGSLRLAASLKRNVTLKILNIGSNCIGDEGGTAIGKALMNNTTLHTIHMHENSIGNDTLFCFSQTLSWHNSTLRILDLASNAIDENGAIALARILQNFSTNSNGNSSLTQLNLSSNPIGNAGAIEFSKVLHTNASLMALDMSHCRISDAGGLSFAEALIFNSRLQTLDLSFNGFSHTLGDQFVSSLTRRSEMLKLLVQGQGISHDMVARINALGPQPPPPPTKWVRPAAQGVMEALVCGKVTAKFKSIQRPGSESQTEKNSANTTSEKCQVIISHDADKRDIEIKTVAKSNVFKDTLKSVRASRAFRKSGSESQTKKSSANTTIEKCQVHISDADKRDIEIKTAAKSNVFKDTLKSVRASRAFRKSGFENHSEISVESCEATGGVKQSSKAISNCDISRPEDPDSVQSVQSQIALRTAHVEASIIVADAHAIASDIIMEAQKHLARLLMSSKSKPLSFEVAQEIATELHVSKSKLADSLQKGLSPDSRVANSTGNSCMPNKASDVSCIAETPVEKASRSTKFMFCHSSPLGFQKCQLIEDPGISPNSVAMSNSHVHVFTDEQFIELRNVSSPTECEIATDLSALPVQEALPAKLSAQQIQRLKSFVSLDNAARIDPFVHAPIEFVSLKSLPFLEMEHLSEICMTDDAISIPRNEITGPMWVVKMRSTDDTELKNLPEHIIVKQFFEEINENFHQEFSLFNAIKGHHCTAVTHVLGNVGLPVGLIFEHLPFLLDEEMLSFSLADAVRVLVQCAAALHSLHVSDIVHSNINTFSFVISKDYSRVKFIEFAIDQSILSSIGFVHRQEPLFTAPELSNESNSPTVLADIYAFGMLIWRLLHPTSLLPFSNAPIAVSLAAARGSLPVFTRAGIPACILDICHRCLARDPNVRPQSMVDVINALKMAQIL